MKIKAYAGRVARIIQNLPVEYTICRSKKSMTKIDQTASYHYDDGSEYAMICRLAAEYDDVFKVFKRSRGYARVLEHVTKEQGLDYLELIKSGGSDLLNFLSRFRENDRFGSPRTYRYDIGRFSPTTLRYMKVLMDLKNYFGDLNGLDIIEIGVGYGGQCKVISDVFKTKSYTLVDLDAVMPLVRKYLTRLNVENVAFLRSCELSGDKEYDLVISNYAFSECVKGVQDHYITRVLYRSRRGYLTCNYDNPSSPKTPYNKEELYQILSRKHNVDVLDEKPKTAKSNFIIRWDDTKRYDTN